MPKPTKTVHSAAPKPADEIMHPETPLYDFLHLREEVMVQVASAIHQRHWTQAQAAAFLGVSQPRISDLITGKAHKFTLDTLIQWLLAMGKPVRLSVGDDTQSGLSPSDLLQDVAEPK